MEWDTTRDAFVAHTRRVAALGASLHPDFVLAMNVAVSKEIQAILKACVGLEGEAARAVPIFIDLATLLDSNDKAFMSENKRRRERHRERAEKRKLSAQASTGPPGE